METPQQDRLASWVNANRAAIAFEINSARRVYVGNGDLGRALVDGQLPNGTSIPGVQGTWSPSGVFRVKGHQGHWHISL
ncbi:MAG: hypothetical protein AAFX85_18790 [Pseudomonadota bacterium]